jgi:hypothetical protein
VPSADTVAPRPNPLEESRETRAESFVRRYFDEFNRALVSTDTSRVRALFRPSCSLCLRDVEFAEGVFAKNHRFQGMEMEILKLTVLPADSTVVTGVVIALRSKAGAILDQHGQETQSRGASPTIKLVVDLVPDGGGWTVADMTQTEVVER